MEAKLKNEEEDHKCTKGKLDDALKDGEECKALLKTELEEHDQVKESLT